ncbi:MAG: hypothetical protein QJR12_04625 [Mycobacterium sp.]|uniref:hypothetical protein n=1 Tax=Mycobacterium sp. TaxID=1785 RepID=UPI002630CE73|nr:hypothetical protein [Mycobacterium sp.]MDI3313582.1 hypothetical protein [Mycobacterium sp.]
MTCVGAAAAGLAAIGLAGALSGCSSGQIAQTAAVESAVNGAKLNLNNVALRDVRIQAVQTGDFLRPGQPVNLVLVAVNRSRVVADRLVSITSEIGTVTLSGDTRLPVGGKLFIGASAGQNVRALRAVEPATAAKATVVLAKPITNGLTYRFTFTFERAGRASVMVPISAPTTPPQERAPDLD